MNHEHSQTMNNETLNQWELKSTLMLKSRDGPFKALRMKLRGKMPAFTSPGSLSLKRMNFQDGKSMLF
jgi:hypothetical protein